MFNKNDLKDSYCIWDDLKINPGSFDYSNGAEVLAVMNYLAANSKFSKSEILNFEKTKDHFDRYFTYEQIKDWLTTRERIWLED
jgi:hypothetical protein